MSNPIVSDDQWVSPTSQRVQDLHSSVSFMDPLRLFSVDDSSEEENVDKSDVSRTSTPEPDLTDNSDDEIPKHTVPDTPLGSESEREEIPSIQVSRHPWFSW